uniref:Uncharacterized protein n=1 Tax=Cucumis melo TaxID=3656 RepID=A0A9I9ELT3_CUCME
CRGANKSKVTRITKLEAEKSEKVSPRPSKCCGTRISKPNVAVLQTFKPVRGAYTRFSVPIDDLSGFFKPFSSGYFFNKMIEDVKDGCYTLMELTIFKTMDWTKLETPINQGSLNHYTSKIDVGMQRD